MHVEVAWLTAITIPAGLGATRGLWYGSGMHWKRLVSVGCGFLAGCGGNTDESTVSLLGGGATSFGTGGTTSHWPVPTGGYGTGGQNYSTYTAVGCPDSGTSPTVTQECDLFSAVSGCPDGQACFPAIRSSLDPCQPERYYYICSYAGNGTQWEDCASANDCAPGYVCVVTVAGTKCQKICSTSDTASGGLCPAGMFCDPIDVAGVGTCS